MYEMPGVGDEYGTDWIVREILCEHLSPANTLEAFEQSVDECYPETDKIGWIEYDVVSSLKELDAEDADGNLITFDCGKSHYWVHKVEHFISTSSRCLEVLTGSRLPFISLILDCYKISLYLFRLSTIS